MKGSTKSVLWNFRFLQKIGPTSHQTKKDTITMTVSDSNAVTTFNNATYWKAVTMGRDEQETLWRSCLQEVFFSIEVQVPVDGVKRNCVASAEAFIISLILKLTVK